MRISFIRKSFWFLAIALGAAGKQLPDARSLVCVRIQTSISWMNGIKMKGTRRTGARILGTPIEAVRIRTDRAGRNNSVFVTGAVRVWLGAAY